MKEGESVEASSPLPSPSTTLKPNPSHNHIHLHLTQKMQGTLGLEVMRAWDAHAAALAAADAATVFGHPNVKVRERERAS